MKALLHLRKTIGNGRRWPRVVVLFSVVFVLSAGCAVTSHLGGGYVYEGLDPPGAAHQCRSAWLPEFAWPMPPEPTSATRVSRRYFDDDWETAPATFHGFIDHVRTRMLSVGYPLPTVFGVGCDGFALVLPMERLRADGRRVEGQDGFAGPGQRSMFDFWGLVQQLIDARPGFYRVIVIVVTTERLHGFADPARPEQLVRLQRMGADELPDQLARRSLRRDYEIYALVYEFEHGRNHAGGIVAERIPPDGRLPPITHLRQAGLIGTRR